MAYDKILSCHARLDRLIQYVCNPKKTTMPETGLILAEALNCDLETAYQDMKKTNSSPLWVLVMVRVFLQHFLKKSLFSRGYRQRHSDIFALLSKVLRTVECLCCTLHIILL